MKLRNWRINGFGIFCDTGLPEPGLGDGINLLIGPNEAGKSTLLDFLRYSLFGYPTGVTLARREPLRGGNYGGTLIYQNDSETYRLFRQPGKRNAFDLRNQKDSALTEQELKGQLGHITATVFRQIFGFSLAELQDIKLMNTEGAGDLIFAASVGSSAVRIRNLQDLLQKQIDGIFKESRAMGRNAPRLLKLSVDLDAIEQKLVQEGEAARAVAGKRVVQEEKKFGFKNIGDSLIQTEKDIGRFDKLIRGWPLWVERCEAENEKKQLGDLIAFPIDGDVTWASLKSDFKNAQAQAQVRSLEVQKIKARLKNLPVEFPLLPLANSAHALATRRANYDVATQLARNATNQATALRQEWNAVSEELGPEWTEDTVRNFDVSLFTEDEARRLTNAIRHAETELSSKRSIASGLARDARGLLTDCVSRSKQLASVLESGSVLSQEEISRQRSRLAKFRQAIRSRDALENELERAKDNLAQVNLYVSQRETSGPQLPLSLSSILVFAGLAMLVVSGALTYLGERVGAGIGAIFGVVLLVLAALLRPRRTHGQQAEKISSTASDAQKRFELAKKALQDHDDYWRNEANSTEFTWPISESGLATWDGRIVAEAQRLSETNALSSDLEELRSKRNTKYRDFHRAKNEFDEAKLTYERAVIQWTDFLRTRGLPETIQMETAISILAKVKQARQHLIDSDEFESVAREQEKKAEEYIEQLIACLRNTALPIASDPAGTLIQFEAFRQRIGEEQRQLRDRQERIGELSATKGVLREAVRIARDARSKRDEFLNRLGVSNEEEFKAQSDRATRQSELSQTIREQNTALVAIFGPSGVPNELKEVSASDTLSDWELAKIQREKEKEDLSRERDKTLQELEALRLEIEKQLNSDEVARLQLEAEELREEIRKGLADWIELACAQELLQRTRSKFEQENQSPALEEASRLFKLITNDRYERIFKPLDSSEITIRRNDGQSVSIECLSQGTLEQLYFSIRLGYIKQYQNQQNVQLPLMMDDVAVNFDAKRMARTFEVLSDCARRGQQILFFTCHEELVKLLRPEDRCFRIEDFQFEREAVGPLLTRSVS